MSACTAHVFAVALFAAMPLVASAQTTQQSTTAATPAPIVSFTLVNSATGKPAAGFDPIRDGAKIDLSVVGKKINVRANPDSRGAAIGSVRFELDDNRLYRVENAAPYFLAGDKDGVVFVWETKAGAHRVTATSFASRNATGANSASKSLSFSILDQPAPAPRGGVVEVKSALSSPLFVGDTTPNEQSVTLTVAQDFVPKSIEVTFDLEGFLVPDGISFSLSGPSKINDSSFLVWEKNARTRTFAVTPDGSQFTKSAKGTWKLTIVGPRAELAGGYVYGWSLKFAK